MPTGQNYATNVPQTFITGQINPTATVMSVDSSSGWPNTPFTAVLELGTSLQEPIDVTNITGTTWTIVRAIDGTTGFTHNPNASVTHADIGRDFRESRSHIDAAASPDAVGHAVHGLTGGSSVVGTTDSQTLSNKTLTSPTLTGGVFNGSIGGSSNLTVTTMTVLGQGGSANNIRFVYQNPLVGPPTGGTYLTGDVVTDINANQWYCTAGGTPGTWTPLGGRALISSQSGVSASYSVTIPTGVTPHRVEVFWRGKSSAAVHNEILSLQINGDSGANYQFERTESNNASVTAALFTGQTAIQIASIGGTSSTANYKGSGHFVIEGVSDSSGGFQTAVGTACLFDTSANMFNGVYTGQHVVSGPVTSFSLFPVSGSWDANSYMAAYAVY